MPDEYCRICGGELVNRILCSDCRKSTQKICKICNSTTHPQIHNHNVTNTMPNQKTVVMQITNSISSKTRKNSLHFSFLAIGVIVGFLILGLTAAYSGTSQGIQDEAQAIDSNNTSINVIDTFPTLYGKSYNNCLAYGSGESLTVTCPDNDGTVYKEILNMPKNLQKDFSDAVFSIRGISITENSDGSVILQYHLKQYVTYSFGI